MATEEQQRQGVVPIVDVLVAGRGRHEFTASAVPRRPTPDVHARTRCAKLIGQSARRDRDQPTPRVLRQRLPRPPERGREQRLLHRVLACVEVPVTTDERAQDLRGELTQQVLDVGVRAHISSPATCISGRTSTAVSRASGMAAASIGRTLGRVALDQVEAAQELPRVQVRLVRHRRLAIPDPNGSGVRRIRQHHRAAQLTRLDDLGLESVVRGDDLVPLLRDKDSQIPGSVVMISRYFIRAFLSVVAASDRP